MLDAAVPGVAQRRGQHGDRDRVGADVRASGDPLRVEPDEPQEASGPAPMLLDGLQEALACPQVAMGRYGGNNDHAPLTKISPDCAVKGMSPRARISSVP